MEYANLYSNLIQDAKLNLFEAERIYKKDLNGSCVLLSSFFSSPQTRRKYKAIIDMMPTSGNAAAITLWLNKQRLGSAEKLELYANLDLELLREVVWSSKFEAPPSGADAEAEALWGRGDPSIRLAVAARFNFWHGVPKSWLQWVRKNYPYTGESFIGTLPPTSEILAMMASNRDFAISLMTGPKAFILKTQVVLASGEDEWEYRRLSRILCGEYVESLEKKNLKTSEYEALLIFLDHLLFKSAPEFLTALRREDGEDKLAKLLLLTDKLENLTVEQVKTVNDFKAALFGVDENALQVITPEDAFKALQEGHITEDVIRIAKENWEEALTAPGSLWSQTAAHAALTPAEAVQLAAPLLETKRDSWKMRPLLTQMLAGRTTQWLTETATRAWETARADLYGFYSNSSFGSARTLLFEETFNALNSRTRAKLVAQIIRSARDAEVLLSSRARVNSALVFEQLKPASVNKEASLHTHAIELMRAKLGDSEVAWENFESLSKDFTGSFTELLNVAATI